MINKKSALTRTVGCAIYSFLTVPIILTAPEALGQAERATEIEEIVVTGSRIARDPNVGANVPVQSISSDDIQLTGEVDLGEVLNDLPSLLGSNTSSNSIIGIFSTASGETVWGAATGETILQLRGLGVERTLVLIDGRRHVAGVGGTQAVDIGSIPQQLIERVEVLTGGASAIYGADAVTGVVNFIMKDAFEGLNVNVSGGVSSGGGAANYSISGIYGLNFDDDKGNISFAVDYTQRDPLELGERPWSRNNGVANDDSNPALRFQVDDIDPATTPNFAAFYSPSNSFPGTLPPCDLFGFNYCFGFHPVGFPILSQSDFIDLWREAFPGDPDPLFSPAELALMDRAANAPTRAILPQHTFSLTSNGGVLLPGGLFAPGLDIDNNGITDCSQSYQGYYSTFDFSPPALGFIGGCWIVEDDGNVRPLRDGLIASDISQFGEDGVPDWSDEDELIPDDWKIAVNLSGHYDILNTSTLFFEGKYVRQETVTSFPLNSFWDLLTISPDNPYIAQLPPALAAVGQAEGLFITRDPNDLGPNIDKGTRETMRFVLGIEGELDNGWDYEFSANYGNFELEYLDRNRVIVDRWFAAIDVIDDGNGNPICRSDVDSSPPPTTPFGIPVFDPGFFTFNPGDGSCRPANIIGGVGAISQQAIDFVTDTVVNRFDTEQFVLTAVVTGDTGDWFSTAAGPVSFAFGAEYRDEQSDSIFDPLVLGVLPVTTAFGNEGDLLSDIFAGVPGTQRSLVFDSESLVQNVTGSYEVIDVFAEVSVPLVKEAALAEDLTLDAAVRFSNYSTVGSTLTWNAGGSWTPVSDAFRMRGSYSVSVRAPNIGELFSPPQGAFFWPVDPCDSAEIAALISAGDPRGDIRAANCVADGISPSFTDPITARFVGETSGNPNLSEEEAKTFSLGLIIAPETSNGLTLTLDYWDITIEDAVDAPSGQSIVDGCYDSIQFPDNQFCALIRRNEDPNSPQFNGLEFIRQQQLNIGKLEATGFDFAARYSFNLQNFVIVTGLTGTKMEKLNRFFDPSNPYAVDPELGELQRPEWAGSFTASVATGSVAINYQMQYIGEQALRSVEIETIDFLYGPAGMADETFVHDLSISWEINDSYSIYGGVNNLTNEKPFITEFAFPVSPIGRFFFLGLDANIL